MEFKPRFSLKERNIINYLRKHGFVIYSIGHKVTQDDSVYGYIEFTNDPVRNEPCYIHYDCDTEMLYTAGKLWADIAMWVYEMNKTKGGK